MLLKKSLLVTLLSLILLFVSCSSQQSLALANARSTTDYELLTTDFTHLILSVLNAITANSTHKI
jgi:PBP1b-binding outer membrane lipoprotein LpoB